MRARDLVRMRDIVITAVTFVTALPPSYAAQQGQTPPPAAATASFEELAATCAPDVHATTLKGLVTTESSGNPYAIGVVGASLKRQPRTHAEAVAAARELERKGFNFSMGLGQVNRYNLARYGETYETVFEPCRNLRAGSAILKDCYQRALAKLGDEQQALRAAFSCYYSGNFTRGFQPDAAGQPSYVQKVVANAVDVAQLVPAVKPQAGEGALTVRSAAPAKGRASSPASAGVPSQWVVFAEAPPRAETPAALPMPVGAGSTSSVKVHLVTPGGASAGEASAQAAQAAVPVAAIASPSRASPPDQEAPFVQFVH